MATTSIWSVKGWLGKVVIYVENPEKTRNPVYVEQKEITEEESQGLSDVIAYPPPGQINTTGLFLSGSISGELSRK